MEPPPLADSAAPALPGWDETYPEPERLRLEVEEAAEAFVQALLEVIPSAHIRGIYYKGSAQKEWQTPIDYVPELSDVDIHILFGEDELVERHLGPVERALEISSRAEKLYFDAVCQPVHTPRIQLVIANKLHQDPDYTPSPLETVKVRLGEGYPFHEVPSETRRAIAVKHLLDNEPYLETLGASVVDMLGKHLRLTLRTMSWRVSPTAPRVLELKGLPFVDTWSANRTQLVKLLRSSGEEDLATTYAEFYLRSWSYFLSGDVDSGAGRAAILAGSRVLRRGVELARD